MLTTFEQVKEWIYDNSLKRWMLYKDYSCKEKIIDSSAFPGDMDDKIAMTEKYLRSVANGQAYAKGGVTAGKDDLDMVAEIRLQDIQPMYQQQPTQGIGGGIGVDQIGEIENRLRKSITSEIEAKMKAEKMEEERREFYKEKKQFEEDRNGVIGAIVGYLAPYLPVLNQGLAMRKVAGTDGEAAQRIFAGDTDQPLQPEKPKDIQAQETQKPEVANPFTDEEEDEVFKLMVRFKKAEPDYLPMLRKVVDMAEMNDTTYQMAKNFLI